MDIKTDHIPYRQIHLDFHTSREIPDVGVCFDPDEFASVLKSAHVNSINLFTKCHHGMYYYPSALGTQHPGLHGFDLFGAQVRACRDNNIRPVAYTCVGWNEDWASRHPEWLMVTYEGIRGNRRPFEKGYYQWNTLCFNQPEYLELLKKEMAETWERYHPDGFWIVNPYFERSYLHFCSHRQTPSMPNASEKPGILLGENYVIISSPLFTDYLLNGYTVHREILRRCLCFLIPDPLIITDLPPVCELTVRKNEQALLVHILSYVIQKKSKRLETIEEVYTALNRDLKIRTEKAPAGVRLVPERTGLPFIWDGGYTHIHLDAVSGHTMLELIMD